MTETTEDIFPKLVRENLQLFIGGTGTHAVYYLVDQYLRGMSAGVSEDNPVHIEISVETDNMVTIEVSLPSLEDPFLGHYQWSDLRQNPCLSTALFKESVRAIQSQAYANEPFTFGHPRAVVFCPILLGVAKKGELSIQNRQSMFSQTYKDGVYVTPIRSTAGGESKVTVKVMLDSALLDDDIQAYPFRLRLGELASLSKGLSFNLKYKGYDPIEFPDNLGISALLERLTEGEEVFSSDPFAFDEECSGYRYRLCLNLMGGEMERLKSYVGQEETYHGGLHENLLRELFVDAISDYHGVEPLQRRQSLDSIACSRMGYYGGFGVTVPFERNAGADDFVNTVPGLVAVIQVINEDVLYQDTTCSRLTGPEIPESLIENLRVAIRKWIINHPEVIQVWLSQWHPVGKK